VTLFEVAISAPELDLSFVKKMLAWRDATNG